MQDDNIKEFGLVIIESLKVKDKKTGEILQSEVIKYKKFQEPNLSSLLFKIATKNELFNTIDFLESKLEKRCYYPIIHFETHGSEFGICLSSGELVSWEELFVKTKEYNSKLKNNLILHLGLCNGGSIIGRINPLDRAPFKAMIGTFREIDENELLVAFEEFYTHFFFSFDVQESVKLMNNIIDKEKKTFYLLTSEYCFDQISNPDFNPDNFKRIASQIAIQYKVHNPAFRERPFHEVVNFVENDIRNFLYETQKRKDYFCMIDLKNNKVQRTI